MRLKTGEKSHVVSGTGIGMEMGPLKAAVVKSVLKFVCKGLLLGSGNLVGQRSAKLKEQVCYVLL
jgi:hypothetical protein